MASVFLEGKTISVEVEWDSSGGGDGGEAESSGGFSRCTLPGLTCADLKWHIDENLKTQSWT